MRSKSLQLLCWFCCPLFVLSQATKIDSLEQVLGNPIHDTIRLDVLDQLFDHYILNDLEKGVEIANQMLRTAEQAGSQPYVCEAYFSIGTVHRKMNIELDTVLAELGRARDCFESIDDIQGKCKVLIEIGSLYHRSGFHAKAMSNYQEALEMATLEQDSLKMIACLANIATVFKVRQNLEKSLQYSKEALSYAQAIDHQLYIGMITNNIANIYFNREILDTALVLYEQVLAVNKATGTELSRVITLANIGGIHINEDRYEQADIYLSEAYSIAKRLKYPYGLGLSLRFMTAGALNQGQYKKAIQLAREGLEVLGERGAIQYSRDFHLIISNSYEELNRPDSALTYLKAYHVLDDSIYQSEKEKQIQQLEITYQVKQKEVENKLLKTEQSYIQEELKNRNYISIGLIIALFLACGWGIALYRNSQAKKRMNRLLETQVAERTEDLQLANKQLKQVNYELQTFNYIASHDIKEPIRNVGNYVSLIFRQLPENIKGELQDYFQIISHSTKQLYTLIEDFANYSNLSRDDSRGKKDVDLSMLLSSIEIGLQSFIQEKNGQIVYEGLPIIETNSSFLYVALKNLIENGIKFNTSKEPRVEITYQSDETHHQITVSDNGIGIDPHYHQRIFVMFKRLHSRADYLGSGIGLALVKLVIEKLEGEVELESQIDKGSTFLLRFPK